jgi:integrase
MSSKRVPSYRLHCQSGQAIVTLTDGLGRRHDVLLGAYGTTESRSEYARVIAEWEANGRRQPQTAARAGLSINELVQAFWKHVQEHYRRPDGTATSEQEEYKRALRPVRHLYGHCPAIDFGPLALKAVRQLMIDGYTHPKYGTQTALARGVVNQRTNRVRRMFKWGVEQEMVPATVLTGLQAVRGLQRGRSQARETEPVKPVALAVVEETLPYMNRFLAAMVRVQLLSGMRPGEVVLMRACDIDVTGPVWLYRPKKHKTMHQGHDRVIALGPQAQEIIKPFFTTETRAYLFSAQLAMAERNARRRRERKTPMTPSQMRRRPKQNPKKGPGSRYTAMSYAHGIQNAIMRGNTKRACDACKSLKPANRCPACKASAIPHWHPHQSRHTRATEIRREVGLDAARAVLGHRSPAVTEVYAQLDTSKAAEVMAEIG